MTEKSFANCALLVGTTFLCIGVSSGAPSPAKTTVLESDSITVLGCRAIDGYEGDCANEVGNRWVDFTDNGEVMWNVTSPKVNRYRVVVAFGSFTGGETFEISSASSTIKGEVHETMGLYDNELQKKHPKNLERFQLDQVLEIQKGQQTVSFRIDRAQGKTPFKLELIELVPVDHEAAIANEQAKAERQRANTDWFVDAKYGVMFHWTTETLPLKGETKSYQEAVRDFDVPAFAEMVELTGAKYVFFTAMHIDPTFPAPIKEWEQVFPGMTTERDLISEISEALGKRNIKLGLYFASGPMAKNLDGSKSVSVDENAYTERVVKLFIAVGKRYGSKLSAYWIDNWLGVDRWYPTFNYERYFEALKAGNPQRIIGLNSNIEVSVTPWQEFWAGEANGDPRALPGGRYYQRGPAKGLQRHGLIHLESAWVHSTRKMKPSDPRYALIGKASIPIEPPKYTEGKLIDFIQGFNENEGFLTININISQEGQISDQALELMKKVRLRFRNQ